MSDQSCSATARGGLARRVLSRLSFGLLLAPVCAVAQTAGPGGIAFWSDPADGLWFDGLRWGAVLPHQLGPPGELVTGHLPGTTPYTVSLLGQGQAGAVHHLSIGNPAANLHIVGLSGPGVLEVHGTQIDNLGSVTIGADDALHDSRLVIASHTTAAGSGRLRLLKPSIHEARIVPANNLGWLLVNGPSHQIGGRGSIAVALRNEGLIEADLPGGDLLFDGLHAVDNRGILRARNGGRLRLEMANGDFGITQDADAEIVIDADSSALFGNCGNQGLRGGSVRGPGVLTITCQGAPMEAVHLAESARLGFVGNTGLHIGPDGLRNDGLINSGPSGFITSRFGESATITGTGRLQLEGGALSGLFGGAGQALVNGAEHDIGGHGVIALALHNQGRVLADRNGEANGPGDLQLQTSAQRNDGLMEARNGGTLRLLGITLEQGLTGTLSAANGSAVVLSSTVVQGGTLDSSGNGLLLLEGSSSRIEDLHVATGAHLLVPCFRELEISGGIDNDGLIEVNNAGCGPNFATLRGQGEVLIEGAGSVLLGASSEFGVAATLASAGPSLVLGPAQTLAGYGTLSGNLRVEGAIAPRQTFAPLGEAGQLILASGAQLQLAPSSEVLLDVLSASSFDRIAGSGAVTLDGTLRILLPTGFETDGPISLDIVSGAEVSGAFDQIILPANRPCGVASVELLPDRARLTLDVPLYCSGFEAP